MTLVLNLTLKFYLSWENYLSPYKKITTLIFNQCETLTYSNPPPPSHPSPIGAWIESSNMDERDGLIFLIMPLVVVLNISFLLP